VYFLFLSTQLPIIGVTKTLFDRKNPPPNAELPVPENDFHAQVVRQFKSEKSRRVQRDLTA
jgi:hypothetical protein